MSGSAGRRTLSALIDALPGGRLSLEPRADRDRALAALGELPAVGPWTASIVAMRALGDPTRIADLGVRRGAQALGLPAAPGQLARRADGWRPLRAYAGQHLWAANRHPSNDWPPRVEPGGGHKAPTSEPLRSPSLRAAL